MDSYQDLNTTSALFLAFFKTETSDGHSRELTSAASLPDLSRAREEENQFVLAAGLIQNFPSSFQVPRRLWLRSAVVRQRRRRRRAAC